MTMRVRNALGPIFTDVEFSSLFSYRGRPALSLGLLAMVSVLQFTERLTLDAWRSAVGGGLEVHDIPTNHYSAIGPETRGGGRCGGLIPELVILAVRFCCAGTGLDMRYGVPEFLLACRP
jgi:hypothetical protein